MIYNHNTTTTNNNIIINHGLRFFVLVFLKLGFSRPRVSLHTDTTLMANPEALVGCCLLVYVSGLPANAVLDCLISGRNSRGHAARPHPQQLYDMVKLNWMYQT